MLIMIKQWLRIIEVVTTWEAMSNFSKPSEQRTAFLVKYTSYERSHMKETMHFYITRVGSIEKDCGLPIYSISKNKLHFY